MKDYYVYMLLCADSTFYVGVTNNLHRRIYEHKTSYNDSSYTSSRLPVKLVYYCIFREIEEAIEWEKQLKRWSKAKKEALIERNWDKIKELSKCLNGTKATGV